MPISWRVREADCRLHLALRGSDANDRALVRADPLFFSALTRGVRSNAISPSIAAKRG